MPASTSAPPARRPAARRVVAAAAIALLLTLASSRVRGTRPEVQDWDCPPAPASCARPVVVAGFPLRYLSDYHGISPVGSVSLVAAALGEDHFHRGAFGANVLFYLVLVGAAWRTADAVRRRRPERT